MQLHVAPEFRPALSCAALLPQPRGQPRSPSCSSTATSVWLWLSEQPSSTAGLPSSTVQGIGTGRITATLPTPLHCNGILLNPHQRTTASSGQPCAFQGGSPKAAQVLPEYRLMPPYLHKHSTTQRRNLKAALPPTTNRTKATWKNYQ